MALAPFIEYADASPAVRAVYDDIMATRKVAAVNKDLENKPELVNEREARPAAVVEGLGQRAERARSVATRAVAVRRGSETRRSRGEEGPGQEADHREVSRTQSHPATPPLPAGALSCVGGAFVSGRGPCPAVVFPSR